MQTEKNKYFGTDGFRGEANVVLTADHAYKIGRFLGWYYGRGQEEQIATPPKAARNDIRNLLSFRGKRGPQTAPAFWGEEKPRYRWNFPLCGKWNMVSCALTMWESVSFYFFSAWVPK